MRWELSWRADPRVCVLADRHYSRQKVGAPQFVPPGGCLVLRTEQVCAYWVTSTPLAEYVLHAWAGAWMNTAFRNEGQHLSSELIREACAATRYALGEPPPLGMVTFVDPEKVKPTNRPGWCYRKAGFEPPPCARCEGEGLDPVGGAECRPCRGTGEARTEAGLVVLQLKPESFPAAAPARGTQFDLLRPAS